ncbi:DNA sulfur modification protein DndD [Vibrio fluvialis]|uniref:DNA sulfur modification protein DndD n=1 Tax=Vibrio fluvialis TaxID=676 RepID=UPI001C9C83C4|nr:DNA sulfur modification protein DndD [Vibrio fluvialis]EKO5124775.1 DNA sulfur modification protein DndD [Vibrio fluvialis]MBY7911338.1 DNA sulfur modification protein DndD [Vibrio fluvialis]MBY7954294.1 DNA sulfur modification protein DndD [Vibrio fluvialis]MBY8065410.1 DNA sulfur modification protein DndD [Vibrio fluvialis]MBY8134268.1 DNA sulfur modification protein DndD [Vibrio fluvialis]
MKFRKLSIENYKSFQFPTEIHFPDSENGKSIFLIGGMNGAGKTSIMESINYCLYGGKADEIFRAINRKEIAKGNAAVSFELTAELDDGSELIVKRSWSAGVIESPKAKDLNERLVVVKDGKRVSVQNQQMWQDFIRATVPPGITQFFFFDGEKIQEIAADDHSEVRLKSSLEAALGIQNINQLSSDLLYLKQEERKGFVEISDEDLTFKESELKKEQAKYTRLNRERDEIKEDLTAFKEQYDEAKKRFQATFNRDPESRDAIREAEKRRIQTSNRLGQLESEIRVLCEKSLPFSLLGGFFDGIRQQIENERESLQGEAIKEHAEELAKKIVRVVEEPEPIYNERLSDEKMVELEKRIFNLLREGDAQAATDKLLNLSDRDAARILQKIEELENSDVFLIKPLVEEKQELEVELKKIESSLNSGSATESEQELFGQLQEEMESCATQIGRKTEQLRILEEDILSLEKKIREIEIEIEKLYEKHNVSKEKSDFINECDAIAGLLNQFIVRMRKSKVHLLQEKTFEMYKLLSSKSGLIKDITIDEKSYEVKISDRNGHEIKKSGLSAGEKEVFALSLLWGLSQTSQLNLPIIIDTPLSRLDSTHRDNIIRNYFPNAGDQVIILSTDTEIDENYFKVLESHLSGAASLFFNHQQELTTIKTGYFWEEK